MLDSENKIINCEIDEMERILFPNIYLFYESPNIRISFIFGYQFLCDPCNNQLDVVMGWSVSAQHCNHLIFIFFMQTNGGTRLINNMCYHSITLLDL